MDPAEAGGAAPAGRPVAAQQRVRGRPAPRRRGGASGAVRRAGAAAGRPAALPARARASPRGSSTRPPVRRGHGPLQDAKQGSITPRSSRCWRPLRDDGADWYAAEAVDLGKDDLEARAGRPAPASPRCPTRRCGRRATTPGASSSRSASTAPASASCSAAPPLGALRSRASPSATSASAWREQARREARRAGRGAAQEVRRQDRPAPGAHPPGRAGRRRSRRTQARASRRCSTVISAGSAVLGMFFGRSRSHRRRQPAPRPGASARTFQERQDVGARRGDHRGRCRSSSPTSTPSWRPRSTTSQERFDPEAGELEVLGLKPKKKDVETRFLTLAWAPKRRSKEGARRSRRGREESLDPLDATLTLEYARTYPGEPVARSSSTR